MSRPATTSDPSRTLQADLDFAVEVAWRAGRATIGHYQTGIGAEAKADASPVTEADRAAERVARQLIGDRFPADAVLGEEDGESGAGAARRWIIDPIDGTRTFIRGVPFFGVLLALETDDRAVLGVMHFPALDETVYAARGLGCWWNGRRARVSQTSRIEDALIVTTDVANIHRAGLGAGWDRLAAQAGLCRTWGDCYGYALVATGRAEAMLDPVLAVWDAAALSPIIEEAGGVYSTWPGAGGGEHGSAVGSNAALADLIRNLLQDRTP
ncbi:MAG TPA: inositol monophosphatase family protein [Longimicrobiales bacterium]|nr:inositol monophosphatase family protein [Longimicrobiales bacterium]